MRAETEKLIDYWFRTRKGKIVVGQKPNPPLIAWFCAKTVERSLPRGKWRDGAAITADGALFYWALLELFDGVNRFRKALGMSVLIGTAASKVCNHRNRDSQADS
jgi:hypothetical protein